MKNIALNNLEQIGNLLQTITLDNYTSKSNILAGASIGQHVRHIVEFYDLLISGSFNGIISYDKRKRDERIEDSLEFASLFVNNLKNTLESIDLNEVVRFEADYTEGGEMQNEMNTTVGRELAYCIEHSIHHQALIKAALIALGLEQLVTNNFGVAFSTIRYRKTICVQ